MFFFVRWDPSSIEHLPEYMKVVFMTFYKMMNEMVEEAFKTQGRDTLEYARKVVSTLIILLYLYNIDK